MRLLPLLLSLGVLQSCGPGEPAIERFEVTPLRLPPGGGNVTLSWQVQGADRIEVNGRTAQTTGEMPLFIDESSNVRLAAFAGEASTTRTAFVRVQAPGGEPGPVSGVVISPEDLQPVSGLTVLVGGHVVQTDEDGRFSVDLVNRPYDLTLYDQDPDRRVLYRRLNASDLTLVAFGFAPPPTRSTDLEVQIVEDGAAQDADSFTFAYVMNAAFKAGFGSRDPVATFDIRPQWRPAVRPLVDVVAFRLSTQLDGKHRYLGFGQESLGELQPSVARTASVGLKSAGQRSLQFRTDNLVPGSQEVAVSVKGLVPNGGQFELAPPVRFGSEGGSINVIDVEDVEVLLRMTPVAEPTLGYSMAQVRDTSLSSGAVELPAPPDLLLTEPTRGLRTIQRGSAVGWYASGPNVCVAHIFDVASASSMYVVTDENVIDFADFDHLMDLASQVSWQVKCAHGPSTLDEAVSGNGLAESFSFRGEITVTGSAEGLKLSVAP